MGTGSPDTEPSLAEALLDRSPEVERTGPVESLHERPLHERLDERWRWRELTLPPEHLGVRDITADGGGRLVAVTLNGLLRYDGSWSAVSGTSDLPGGRIETVVATAGGLLLRVQGHGIWWLPEEGRPHVVASAEVVGEGVGRLFALDDRSVLVPFGDGYAEVAGGRVIARYPSPVVERRRPLRGAHRAPSGVLYAAGVDGPLRWDGTSWHQLPLPHEVNQHSSYGRVLIVDGRPWFFPGDQSTRAPVLEWDGERLVERGAPQYVRDAVQLPGAGVVFADRLGGLRSFDGADWRPSVASGALRLRPARLEVGAGERLAALDAAGRLWLCNQAARTWRHFRPAPDREANIVHAIAPSRRGGVWVATSRGLYRWDGGRFVERHEVALGIPLEALTAVDEDELGRVWVGSGSRFPGALRLVGARWERVTEPFAGHCIHAIETTRDGAQWFLLVGTLASREAGGGGAVRREGWHWRRYTTVDGLPHDRTYDVSVAQDGRAFLATFGGLAVLEGERWRSLATPVTKQTRVVHVDRGGAVWVAKGLDQIGVHRWRDGAWTEVVAPLAGLMVAGFADADGGGVWVASPMGLFRHDELGLHEVTGAPSAPFRPFWPVVDAGDGSLWLGGLGDGLVRYHPDRDTPPVIHDLRIARDGESGLEHVQWAGHDPWGGGGDDRLRYRWRLDGGEWRGPTNDRALAIEDLAPRAHRIEVTALDDAGLAGPSTELRFRVRPPFYLRPALLLLVGAGLLSLAILGATVRRERRARRRAEAYEHRKTQASERHFRRLVERAHVLFASCDRDGRLDYVSPSFTAWMGGAISGGVDDLLARMDEVSGESVELLRRARAAEVPRPQAAELGMRAGADVRWLHLVQSPRVEAGCLEGFDLVAVDVTERREAERERGELDNARRQSQKMQAVGQLAAGVAHDFNNILTAVSGNAELLAMELGENAESSDTSRHYADQILRAAQRAAALTSQLLAFSHQQVLRPRRLDLVRELAGLREVLERVVREDIALEWSDAGTLPTVRIDPAQLEQVLLNLVLNACDAMEGGGVLRISTGRCRRTEEDPTVDPPLAPGDYAVLRVADTGTGMDAATRQHIFEPFFTTKEVGRGTGLGLSTVHGIVRQMGGGVAVDTAPGRGTVFTVYLPAARALESVPSAGPEVLVAGGSETVLICEDDDAVRHFAARVLHQKGYSVLDAATPSQALRIATELRGLSLLLTDVVLPEFDGPSLARRAGRLHPGLRVLYMSGYAPSPSLPEDGERMLRKPFQAAQLARRVRETLDRRSVTLG